MASGSTGSARLASSNQAANSRNGSSASAKSPDVNQLGCVIGAVSVISQNGLVAGPEPASASRWLRYNGTAGSSIWRPLRLAAVLMLALPAGACSFSYQLGSLFGQDTAKPEVTGAVAAKPVSAAAPTAAAYTQDGFVCRDFLASYVRQGTESWLQGEGCRIHQGRWEVRAMRPW